MVNKASCVNTEIGHRSCYLLFLLFLRHEWSYYQSIRLTFLSHPVYMPAYGYIHSSLSKYFLSPFCSDAFYFHFCLLNTHSENFVFSLHIPEIQVVFAGQFIVQRLPVAVMYCWWIVYIRSVAL